LKSTDYTGLQYRYLPVGQSRLTCRNGLQDDKAVQGTPAVEAHTGPPAGRRRQAWAKRRARPGDRHYGICNRHSGVFLSSLFAIKAQHE
jgi:hypothetical protein